MKKLLFLFLFLFVNYSVFCQTLFTYGNKSVSSAEFLKAYNKNKSDTTGNNQELRDYLNLYMNFKLKVQAAKDLRLDTLPALKSDLQNFRSQVEENYLRNEKAINALTDEAFVRSQKDIHVIHFFLPLRENAGEVDTVKDFEAINSVYRTLKLNKNNSQQVLANLNNNGISVSENDLGFITVFTLPYEFENIIYGLKVNEISAPYRTKQGWHIFKNIAERPAVGKVKIAQILFALPQGANEQLKAQTKKLAYSVYTQLKNGADFSVMAKEFSDDRMTFMDGGNLQEFGVGKYDPSFEKIAFSLDKDSSISLPFETPFGFHIIKRISATAIPADKKDETFMLNLKQEVLNDSRISKAKKIFISEIIPKTGLKKYKINEQDLWKITDSALLENKNIKAGNLTGKSILFSFNNNEKVTVENWIRFLKNANKMQEKSLHESYPDWFEEFTSFSVTENYKKRLDKFNEEFKNQLDEFKDGNMLFEIMERKVWDKASSDSAGLINFYTQHKEKYKWNKSADAIIFSANNETTAKNNIQYLMEGKLWKSLVIPSPSKLQADSGRFELTQLPVNNQAELSVGMITDPVINKNDGTAVFVKIIKLYPGNESKVFEDARGLVINDYQNLLEENWIKQLKKQYPVHINQKAFQNLLK